MAKRKRPPKPLPTLWRVPDPLWAMLEPILAERDPPKTSLPQSSVSRLPLPIDSAQLVTGSYQGRPETVDQS